MQKVYTEDSFTLIDVSGMNDTSTTKFKNGYGVTRIMNTAIYKIINKNKRFNKACVVFTEAGQDGENTKVLKSVLNKIDCGIHHSVKPFINNNTQRTIYTTFWFFDYEKVCNMFKNEDGNMVSRQQVFEKLGYKGLIENFY